MSSPENISRLWELYVSEQANPEQVSELFDLIAQSADDVHVHSMQQALSPGEMTGMARDSELQYILDDIIHSNDALRRSLAEKEIHRVIPTVHRVHFLRTAWFRYAAAILVVLGSVFYLYRDRMPVQKPLVTTTKPSSVENTIAPGGDKAILTLSDGRKIVLDSAVNGALVTENGNAITKKDGQIIYQGQRNNSDVVYNTMTTPKGGQYQVTLADGTKVWLNAASRITYPTVFTGNIREVNITGEVYFEVAANKSKPFVVKTIKDDITVMGTRFNINAYPDEQFMKTSLVDGAVKINDHVLKPGQGYANGKIINTNIDQDIAWISGEFNFNNADIKTVMRQLARWYDIDVKYEGGVPKKTVKGEMGRNLNLSEVLEVLNDLGVRTNLEQRTLTIYNRP